MIPSRPGTTTAADAHTRRCENPSPHFCRNSRCPPVVDFLAPVTPVVRPARSVASMEGASTDMEARSAALEMLGNYEAFVFDLDGTIWKGNEVIDGAAEVLDMLRAKGKKVIFVTNNSMKSRQAYMAKFQLLGLHASLSEIYCSSYSAAAYLKSIGFSKKAYVVGEQGIMDELQLAGIVALGGPAHNDMRVDFNQEVEVDAQVGAVVVGVDPGLSYFKVAYASLCILQHGALFVATNTDSRGHFIPGQEWPGAGATSAAIEAVVEHKPIVTGKPADVLVAELVSSHGIPSSQMLMVGDRLDTDIQWGLNTGMGTLLVMTGVTTPAMLAAAKVKPKYVLASVGALLAASDAGAV